MPSTVVHLALAGLIAAGLLGRAFSARSLAVVLAAVVLVDFDVFVGLVVTSAHRAAFHTLLVPLGVAAALAYDTRIRDSSLLRARFGTDAPRIGWVSLVAVVLSAIGLDFFTSGVNLFYPLHDQFYRLNGKAILSNKQGFVQTFVELDTGMVEAKPLGSTQEMHVDSGVDPTRGAEPKHVRRVFPFVETGWQFLLVLTSLVVVGGRLRET
ncbi:metal-dependent hydrolase [Halorientalis brevis]|uniref:Metal-dependent hydrolase n=1 Tax=Halorientalis brevis TaxID=1126241 RepID=A0ABD6C7I4_9EURY|nr:metal-dependent hydrolase [Halorientalis brevis]